jgi:hypothetical protein
MGSFSYRSFLIRANQKNDHIHTFVLPQKYAKSQDGANAFVCIKIPKYKQYNSRVGKFKAQCFF